jgi:S1-C subfamily serine protease
VDFSQQFDLVKDSVVNLLVLNNLEEKIEISSGTGVLISQGDVIITCAHCVYPENNFARINGSNIGEPLEVIFYDDNLDIAILKARKYLGIPAKLKDSSTVKIGQEAFVLGFPHGVKDITLLSAHIAGYTTNNLIRIDSPVNHGNSGGPLFNTNGEVVGIVNLKHGRLSYFLEEIKELQTPENVLAFNMVNPGKIIKQVVTEMEKNLNLGLGYAIPINSIGKRIPEIQTLIK